MADDADAGIAGEHALEPAVGIGRAVGDDHHPGVNRIADADAAAVVDRHPRRAGGGVQQGVQQRPVGDGVAAVAHALGLAVGRGHRAGVEVIAADDDRRRHAPLAHQLVEPQPEARPLAVAEPEDPRRQSLERDPLLRQADPAAQRRVAGEHLERRLRRWPRRSAGSPESTAQRNGPLPSQKSGRTYSGTKPGISNASATPARTAWARMLLP